MVKRFQDHILFMLPDSKTQNKAINSLAGSTEPDLRIRVYKAGGQTRTEMCRRNPVLYLYKNTHQKNAAQAGSQREKYPDACSEREILKYLNKAKAWN